MTRFRISRIREALFGIAEVEGHHGLWPLRRPVRYRVGVNCDAITVERETVLVLRAGAPIATAAYRPPARNGASSGAAWEDLLRRHERRD
jgi:hypothetical protein